MYIASLPPLLSLAKNHQRVSNDTRHFAIYEDHIDRVFRPLEDGDGVVLETNRKYQDYRSSGRQMKMTFRAEHHKPKKTNMIKNADGTPATNDKIADNLLAYALENTDLNKTPGPDGIHGRMISNLGKIGKERLLNIFNNSWKTRKLPQDCKMQQ
ncbi:hypothetical protein LAZ67_14003126 [Cordylochernes scorpioides]|uniref:Uncharacterized protein n=1 Tax=Cordylochernes scorpioides TaxID=51811 RepID=A0ABY6LC85_9ARAC|nr:hypothetical protein LAZ67_14003126 [Cordylochernes scorpioides]